MNMYTARTPEIEVTISIRDESPITAILPEVPKRGDWFELEGINYQVYGVLWTLTKIPGTEKEYACANVCVYTKRGKNGRD